MVHFPSENTQPATDELVVVRLTAEEIEAGRSPAGGFTKDQLAAWGVGWPPPKGWKERLTAGDVFEAYVPEPVSADDEAWARALCEAADDEPDRIVGCPALPLWRSYVTYGRQARTAANRLRGGDAEGVKP